MKTIDDKIFDVCIVGAGPAALSCLSAIQEPYSLDSLNDEQVQRAVNRLSHKHQSVAVIDPHGKWMEGWNRQFRALGIQHLRSPALAHPDMFDSNALLAFAIEKGRQHELFESGCGDLKSLLPLGQSQIGLWKLPSLRLFTDFCYMLSNRLPHDLIHGTVADVDLVHAREPNRTKSDYYQVHLQNGDIVRSKAVILAMGSVGRPIIPASLKAVENRFIVPWIKLDTLFNTAIGEGPPVHNVLVIGGGLTAVQVAQRVIAKGVHSVTLCSRRPLVERHFDIDVKWFDRRTTTYCMSEFYHLPHEERLELLKESRGGGSVPAVYMKDVRRLEAMGRLRRVVGEAKHVPLHSDDKIVEKDHVMIDINGTVEGYDAIVIACGLRPDCESNPLCQNILKKWPVPIIGGFPCVSEDSEWNDRKLFAVGGLSSLCTGPDAANLMGMRRSAQIVANALGCRCWLREANVLKNPFDALMTDDTDSESESSEDES